MDGGAPVATAAQPRGPGLTLSDFANQLSSHIKRSNELIRAGHAGPGLFRQLENELESAGAALDTITALYDEAATTLEAAGEALGVPMDASDNDDGPTGLELFRENAIEELPDDSDEAAGEDLASSSQAVPVDPRGRKLRKY